MGRLGRAGQRRGQLCTAHLPQPPAFPLDSMPPNYERNFGFTQFALELNELTAELKRSLPSTDTRLRPDQRSVPGGRRSGSSGLLPPHVGFHADLARCPSFLELPRGDGTRLGAELGRHSGLGFGGL